MQLDNANWIMLTGLAVGGQRHNHCCLQIVLSRGAFGGQRHNHCCLHCCLQIVLPSLHLFGHNLPFLRSITPTAPSVHAFYSLALCRTAKPPTKCAQLLHSLEVEIAQKGHRTGWSGFCTPSICNLALLGSQ